MKKVLVKKAISAQYPVGAGAPVMVLGGGGRGGGGKTKRQMLGGALGGLVGVAGALTGQHRSLGGLTQSMISGGAQGKALGESVGRFVSGRGSRASADLKDKRRQASAEEKAARGVGITAVTAPIESARRRKATREAERLAALPEIPFGPEPTPIQQVPTPEYTEDVPLPGQEEQFAEMAGVELTPMEAALERLNQAQRVEVPPPPPADIEFLNDPYPVARRDPMADSPIAQGAPPLQPSTPDLSATHEIMTDENAGAQQAQKIGMDHDGELTENEKALQRTLEQNQQRPNEEEEQQQRPPFSRARVQPSNQTRLSDY